MELISVTITSEYDSEPDISWLEQDCFNDSSSIGDENYGRNRIATFGDEWHMIGIIATATFELNDGTLETFDQSLFNVESDSDSSYLQDIGESLIYELRIDMGRNPRYAQFCEFDDSFVDWQIFTSQGG